VKTATTSIRPRRGLLDLELGELWRYRELLFFFVWRDVKVRYKQTVLGAAWAILQPLFTMLVFTLFFGHLGKMPAEGLPYPVFYFAALVPWTYFANAMTQATSTMIEHQRVITKVYFPRLALPLSAVLSALVDFGIAFAVLVALLVAYGVTPGPAAFTLPLFLLLAVVTAFAVGLWLSALNARYRDVRYVVPFLVQFWMFASPVVYPSSLVPERWRWLYGLNPMAGTIDGFRWALTGRGEPAAALLLASASAVLVLLAGGLVYFQRVEGTIADVV
jgi:lipopolysaccharide transport system permease protein